MIAGCTGNEKDWEVLASHLRRKLVVMMELIRTAEERISLREVIRNIFKLKSPTKPTKANYFRFLARKQVLDTLMNANVGNNPGSCIDKLQIPRNMQQYLKYPIY